MNDEAGMVGTSAAARLTQGRAACLPATKVCGVPGCVFGRNCRLFWIDG
jgi:hypothetical protein